MIRIEIKSAEFTSRSFSDKTGKPRTVQNQEAYAFLAGAYPERIEIALWDRAPYAPGYYTLSPDSVFVGKYKSLELKRSPTLVPLPNPKA